MSLCTYHGTFFPYRPKPNPEKISTTLQGIYQARNTDGEDYYDVRATISEEALVVVVPADSYTIVAASKGPLMVPAGSGQRLYSLFPAPAGITPEQALRGTLDPIAGAVTLR